MKILVIDGSPKGNNSNTMKITNRFLEGLNSIGENEINIIAVSQDKGWKNFSEGSDRITLVSSLAEALEKFQPHNKVVSIISHIREDSLLDGENHVLEEIEQAIINSVDGCDIWVEASSYMHFEWEDVSASYISHELDKDVTVRRTHLA